MVRQQRIRSIESHLWEIRQGERFYIIKKTTRDDENALQKYGLLNPSSVVPRPYKRATTNNAEGSWKIHRDLPKEPRWIEHEYHIVDWHGDDHYGTCYQQRMCFQRTRIPPTCYELIVTDGRIESPLLENVPEHSEKNTLIMNMFLEIFGECEVVTEKRESPLPVLRTRQVPWTILPPGHRSWQETAALIEPIMEQVPHNQRMVISQRHKTIHDMGPDFSAMGTEGFWGYIVYGFTNQELYVFESNRYDNATYIFRGDWETASRLTKMEILCGGIHERRLFHTDNWRRHLTKAIA